MNEQYKKIPAVALRGMVILPGMVAHFDVSRSVSIRAIEAAMMEEQTVFLVTQKNIENEELEIENLYGMGIIASVKQVIKLQNSVVRVLIEGEVRARLMEIEQGDCLMAWVDPLPAEEEPLPAEIYAAMMRGIQETFTRYCLLNSKHGKELARQMQEIMDLEKLLDRKPRALSGGQRQRVAMGRAIVRSPKVFLMDEPLSNLDAKLRVQMRTEISKLHQRLGATIIYVTHDQTEAMTLGTRIVVMKDGVVQQIDSPQTLYNHPGNLFVASFIGSPQMNFLNAVCEVEGNNAYLKVADYRILLSEERAKKLIDGGYAGKEVVMGIRPEDVSDEATTRAVNMAKVKGTVNVYELLGAEVYLYFDLCGTQMTARVSSATTAKEGDQVEFVLNTDKIHVFDKETERTITN